MEDLCKAVRGWSVLMPFGTEISSRNDVCMIETDRERLAQVSWILKIKMRGAGRKWVYQVNGKKTKIMLMLKLISPLH